MSVKHALPRSFDASRFGIIKPVKKISEIELLSTQIKWANQAKDILMRNHGYIDTSPMGAGKTVVTLWLAKEFGFKLLIVCPLTLMDNWKREAEKYGVEIIDVISYQSLRSQTNHQPKHGYLTRHDIIQGDKKMTTFTATDKYKNILREGVMVVLDEIHFIKNNSAQHKACNGLIDPIINGGGLSRYALVSGSPFDKEKLAINLLKLIGYIKAPKLYRVDNATHELILEGLQELIDACCFINREETIKVLDEIPISKKNMESVCFTLYCRVIRKHICGSMPKPDNIIGKFDVKNGFYPITGNNAIELEKAIKEWAHAIKYNENTGVADMASADLGRLKKAMIKAERSKVYDMCIQAHNILTTDINAKFIICLNHHGAINDAAHYLGGYNPLLLTGRVKKNQRSKVVSNFNTDPNCRLMIMNPDVGGIGLSLHDTVGNAPRYMFISPSYKLIETTQAASRIHRFGTLTDATVRMFYGNKDGLMETKILTAMNEKTKVVKAAIDDVACSEILLPGDYENQYY